MNRLFDSARAAGCTLCLLAGALVVGCATAPPVGHDKEVEALARAWIRTTPGRPIVALRSAEEGMAVQPVFLRTLGNRLGEPVGYKVALTSEAARRLVGADAPIYGVLFEKMLVPSPATLRADSGVRLFVEADLIVRVGSGIINNAETPEQAGPYIDAVFPFIEVPDLFYTPDIPLSVADLGVINAGARFGVLGEPLRISMREDGFERLAAFRVELLDGRGEVVARGQARDTMGHPLAAVLWLRDALHAEGRRLKRGDLISVGSFSEPIPVVPGASFTARYIGLAPGGPVDVDVRFE